MIRFYYKVDPDELSEEKFWRLWYELEYVLKQIGHTNG